MRVKKTVVQENNIPVGGDPLKKGLSVRIMELIQPPYQRLSRILLWISIIHMSAFLVGSICLQMVRGYSALLEIIGTILLIPTVIILVVSYITIPLTILGLAVLLIQNFRRRVYPSVRCLLIVLLAVFLNGGILVLIGDLFYYLF